MNSKFILFAIFSFFVIAINAYQYTIKTGLGDNYFEKLDGSLKLRFHGRYYQNTYVLNRTELANRRVYTSKIDLPFSIQEVSKVVFLWTLKSPYPPKYIVFKPSIYLKNITIEPTYIQNPDFRKMETRYFINSNPGKPIKHKEEVLLP